ncbi:MAG: hypothetical protein K6T55_12010 [Syntrophobacterales bacterium]|nr:hypothetical protein [Syntrophobacterales bacterium]
MPSKNFIVVAGILIALVLVPLPGAAEEPAAGQATPGEAAAPAADKVEVTLSVDILSQYIFRGIAFSRDSAVIQPSFTVSYKGLSANIWGNFDTNERNPFGIHTPNRNNPKWNETDFTLSYSREVLPHFTLTGGMIYYALDGNTALDDSFEIFAGFGYKFPWFEVGFTAYREVSHLPGWYLQWYISRSFALPFAGASLDLYAAWSAVLSNDRAAFPTPDGGYYRDFNAGLISATLNIPVTKQVKISPKIMYWYALGGDSTYVLRNLSWDRTHNHILGGVGITASF